MTIPEDANLEGHYPFHYRLSQAQTFEWPGLIGRAYSGEDEFANASAARISVTTRHGRVLSTASDRVYLILTGCGWFDVSDEVFNVGPHDLVIVPKGTAYDYGGLMELFLVHLPAYRAEAEEVVE